MWTRTRLWLAGVLGRRGFERDLSDEVRFHVEARADYWRRQGLPPEEAARRARLEFGSPGRTKDEVRDVRLGLWAEQLGQDLWHGVRVLVHRPGWHSRQWR